MELDFIISWMGNALAMTTGEVEWKIFMRRGNADLRLREGKRV